MSVTIKIRRGLETARSGWVFESGEIVYTTDEEILYIGDGATAGGLEVKSTHQSTDGTDHTFIDQDVRSSASPKYNRIQLKDQTTVAYDLIVQADSDTDVMTANRTLTVDVHNEDRVIDLLGDLSVTGNLSILGGFDVIMNTTGPTNITLPESGLILSAEVVELLLLESTPALTDAPVLDTVGTITTGVWEASVIDISHGGTGLTGPYTNGELLIGKNDGTLVATTLAAGSSMFDITNGDGTILLDIQPANISHGALQPASLLTDDHPAYILVDGTRDLTGEQIGITPTNDFGLTTKVYVDQVAQGLDFKESVDYATVGALPACTVSGSGVGKKLTATVNGAMPDVDGETPVLNDRVLVKDQGNTVDNGIYDVTLVGDVGTPWELTRSEDFDGSPANEVSGGGYTFAEKGTANANTSFVVTSNGEIDVDTDPIVWAKFSGTGQIVPGDAMEKVDNNILNVVADEVTITALTGDQLQVNVIDSGTFGP